MMKKCSYYVGIVYAALISSSIANHQMKHESSRQPENRRLQYDTIISASLQRLRAQYLALNGQELADDMLLSAVEKARSEASIRPRFSRSKEVQRIRFDDLFLDADIYADADADNLRRMNANGFGSRGGKEGESNQNLSSAAQDDPLPTIGRAINIVLMRDGVLVSGLSPGWPWNQGRNEYWCVGIPNFPDTVDPLTPSYYGMTSTKLSLLNCSAVDGRSILVEYTDDMELRFPFAGFPDYDVCAETSGDRNGDLFRASTCDIYDIYQQFLLLEDDNTVRLSTSVDNTKCMQGYGGYSSVPYENPDDPCGGYRRELWHEEFVDYPPPPADYGDPCYDPYGNRQRQLFHEEDGGGLPPKDKIFMGGALKINDCATEIGMGRQPAGCHRLGKNKNGGGNDCKMSSDRSAQVFIFCFETIVCNPIEGGISCQDIELCDFY